MSGSGQPVRQYPCGVCGCNSFLCACRQRDKFGQPISLAVCATCGTRQLNPRASDDEQRQFYRKRYYRLYKRNEKRRSPGWVAKKREVAAGMLDAVEARTPLTGQRLLDVGCGHGFLLEVAGARGARVFGVEPDEGSARALREAGVSVFAGSLEGFAAVNLESFDVITLCHVLEHVSRPVESLRSVRALLNPQGLLCVEVPNARRPAVGRRPALLPHAAHLYYFSETTLRAAFQKAGFEVLAASFGRGKRDVQLVGRPGEFRRLDELTLDYPEQALREARAAMRADSPTLRQRLLRLFA